MTRDEFVRILSKRTGLAIIDTKIVMDEIEKIFTESIVAREPIDLRGILL